MFLEVEEGGQDLDEEAVKVYLIRFIAYLIRFIAYLGHTNWISCFTDPLVQFKKKKFFLFKKQRWGGSSRDQHAVN